MNKLTKNDKINEFIREIENYGTTYERLDAMRKQLLDNPPNNDEPKKEDSKENTGIKSGFDLGKSLEKVFKIPSTPRLAGRSQLSKKYKFMDLLNPGIEMVSLTTIRANTSPICDGWYIIKDIIWSEEQKEIVKLHNLGNGRQINLSNDMFDYVTTSYIEIKEILLKP